MHPSALRRLHVPVHALVAEGAATDPIRVRIHRNRIQAVVDREFVQTFVRLDRVFVHSRGHAVEEVALPELREQVFVCSGFVAAISADLVVNGVRVGLGLMEIFFVLVEIFLVLVEIFLVVFLVARERSVVLVVRSGFG